MKLDYKNPVVLFILLFLVLYLISVLIPSVYEPLFDIRDASSSSLAKCYISSKNPVVKDKHIESENPITSDNYNMLENPITTENYNIVENRITPDNYNVAEDHITVNYNKDTISPIKTGKSLFKTSECNKMFQNSLDRDPSNNAFHPCNLKNIQKACKHPSRYIYDTCVDDIESWCKQQIILDAVDDTQANIQCKDQLNVDSF
ncbi:hypothetical protein CDIK_3844 [Cucumispora dikerogammari]|nr:hypothetical protein CDIK_3844 [Cucumispora dikerogammari]